MKPLLNIEDQGVIQVMDELTLWSAPFGRLLLENIPMESGWTVVDLGFGTGFPLIELSQRFGNDTMIYGVDPWSVAVDRVRQKIEVFGISNIVLFELSAASIPLDDGSIDLITSNLGVNNFEDPDKVYLECLRVLKPDGRLALTTNPIGTFKELFDLFERILSEFNEAALIDLLNESIARRGTQHSVVEELGAAGFSLTNSVADETSFRFVNAAALLDHNLIRFGFRESWEQMIPVELRERFFDQLTKEINDVIAQNGEFAISVPMLYLEFEKDA